MTNSYKIALQDLVDGGDFVIYQSAEDATSLRAELERTHETCKILDIEIQDDDEYEYDEDDRPPSYEDDAFEYEESRASQRMEAYELWKREY